MAGIQEILAQLFKGGAPKLAATPGFNPDAPVGASAFPAGFQVPGAEAPATPVLPPLQSDQVMQRAQGMMGRAFAKENKGGILGRIGDAVGGTFNAMRAPYLQQNEAASLGLQKEQVGVADAREKLEQLKRDGAYPDQNVGGAVVRRQGDGSYKEVYRPAPQTTEGERLLERYLAMPDTDPNKAIIRMMLKGYNYSDEFLAARADEQARVKATTPGKAPSVAKPSRVEKTARRKDGSIAYRIGGRWYDNPEGL